MRRKYIFYVGQLPSLVGGEAASFAIPLLAITVLGASATSVGAIYAAAFAPGLLAPLFAGQLVDRYGSVVALIFTELLRVALMVGAWVLYGIGVLTPAQLVFLVLVNACANAIGGIAIYGVARSQMEGRAVEAAAGVIEGTKSLAGIIGPALAGAVAQLIDPVAGVALAAVAHGWGALILLVINRFRIRRDDAVGEPAASNSYFASIKYGFAAMNKLPLLRLLAFSSSFFNFFALMCGALITLHIVRNLGFDEATAGVVLGAAGVGGFLGGMVASRLPRTAYRTALSGGLLGGSFLNLALFAVRGDGLASVVALVVVNAFSAFAVVMYASVNAGLRQRLIPEESFGRVMTALRFISGGAPVPGALIAGFLAESLGYRKVFFIAFVAQAVVALALRVLLGRAGFARTIEGEVSVRP